MFLFRRFRNRYLESINHFEVTFCIVFRVEDDIILRIFLSDIKIVLIQRISVRRILMELRGDNSTALTPPQLGNGRKDCSAKKTFTFGENSLKNNFDGSSCTRFGGDWWETWRMRWQCHNSLSLLERVRVILILNGVRRNRHGRTSFVRSQSVITI